MFAQPLYVQYLAIPGKGVRNVLYVVTMNDWVYALDADSNSVLWSVDLTAEVPGSAAAPISTIISDASNILGNVGIESTPVIDLSTHTMYLVARTVEAPDTAGCSNAGSFSFCQRLHAMDITTGAEKLTPVTIGAVTPQATFSRQYNNQRAGLALANGQIYIAWASHQDENFYHGWIMTYSASTLQQTGVFCVTPTSQQGGVWMSGRAPAVDSSGNVYYMTGNGPKSGGGYDGVNNFSESMLKFPAGGSLSLNDWFTPYVWANFDNDDNDYGSSGPLLIPGTDLITGAGKSGYFYVMHTNPLVPLAQLLSAKNTGRALSRIDYAQPSGSGTQCNLSLVEVQ